MTLSVCHILAPAPYGGLESVIEVLAPAQAAAGHDVTVVCVYASDPGDEPFWQSLQGSRVRAVPLVLPGRQYRAERARIREILVQTGARIAHTHGYRPDVLAAPVARAAGVKTVTTVHGFIGGSRRNRLYEWMQRRAYRRFDAVVAVSEKLRGEVVASGVAARRVHVVRNAWRPTGEIRSREAARAALGLPADAVALGWVGRLQAGKGPDVALRALAQVDAGVELVFVGDGPDREALEAQAAELGVADRVRFAGRVSGAGRLLKAFDGLVMSSWSEGTPMVILEAMAAEVPIVTTAVGGIPDVVSGEEAVLVPAGDAAGLAGGIRSVLADTAATGHRVVAARRKLELDFAVEPWVDRYRAIYDACLAP